MPKKKQTMQRRWPMSLISAFFYPASEAEVRDTIVASQEERKSAEEIIRVAEAFHRQLEEDRQKAGEGVGGGKARTERRPR